MNMALMTGTLPPSARQAETTDSDPALLIREQLLQSRRVAREGAPHRARRLCATCLLDGQDRILRDPPLFELALATLFEARAFQMLRRLLAAASGAQIRFAADPPDPDSITSAPEADGTLVIHFAETLFDNPARDALIDSWSRAEAARISR